MKNIILLITVMVLSACATTSTVKSVAGAYEYKEGEDTWKLVFLENGIGEDYENGKKSEFEFKWKLVNGGIHAEDTDGGITVLSINKDGSITDNAYIERNGKRKDRTKESQTTYKKIK